MAARTVKKAEEERVMIIIPKPNNVVGDTETMVGINGKMYQIEYDKPVMVPKNVAEVVMQSRALQAKIAEEVENSVLKPGKKAIADL